MGKSGGGAARRCVGLRGHPTLDARLNPTIKSYDLDKFGDTDQKIEKTSDEYPLGAVKAKLAWRKTPLIVPSLVIKL
jgi:hypothetical protein